MNKLADIATRIRTPLAVTGLVLVILYGLYRQVLSLPVFSDIGASPTFLLLQNVLDKLFWLALVALILGVGSYLITVLVNRQPARADSNLELLESSLDPRDSPYQETLEGGKKKIEPRAGLKSTLNDATVKEKRHDRHQRD